MGKDFKEWNLDGFEGGKFLYFLVGDELFPLQEWLIKPYSKSSLTSEMMQIFNYGVIHLVRTQNFPENFAHVLNG